MDRVALGQHIREGHSNVIKWQCTGCNKDFETYTNLYDHMANYHFLGEYECSVASCKFTGEYRGKLYTHFRTMHCLNQVCTFAGCGKQFKSASSLASHINLHRGVAPYKCKWPGGCSYESSSRTTTINHIRAVHFLVPRTKKEREKQGTREPGNPNDYIEFVQPEDLFRENH